MITIFSTPKPFTGHISIIQKNAIRSWDSISPKCDLFLFGKEVGTREMAENLGATYIENEEVNNWGTPLVNDMFTKAQLFSDNNLFCFINSDIILDNTIWQAIKKVKLKYKKFLIVGRCINYKIIKKINFTEFNELEDKLKNAKSFGKYRSNYGIDYFIFTRGLYDNMPKFAIGRGYFDNWLVWYARKNAVVIDATYLLNAIHQDHHYKHIKGGQDEAYCGKEASQNFILAGGEKHRYAIFDASHKLYESGLKRNWTGYFRIHYYSIKIGKFIPKIPGILRSYFYNVAKPLGIRRSNFVKIINYIRKALKQ